MGKGKLKLELISKEKSRILTFKKRKQGLFTKLHQLTTLCDVNACIIIFGPRQEHGATEPEIWPQNPDQIRRIIRLYEARDRGKGSSSSSSGNNKSTTFGLSDFFDERTRRIEEEIGRLRRENMRPKYSTPTESLNSLTEDELRELGTRLKNKVEIVKSRIELLKGNQRGLMNQNQSQKYSHVLDESTAAMGDLGVFHNLMAVAPYSVPPVLPPLYMHCAEMDGVMSPQMQFRGTERYENHDGGLDGNFQCATGMGGVAPPLYSQCEEMGMAAPPLHLQCAGMGMLVPSLCWQCAGMGVLPPSQQFPWSMENYETDGGL